MKTVAELKDFVINPTQSITPDVKVGEGVKIFNFVNLYGCTIGDRTKVGTFVEIQKNAFIGADCKISSHSFVCEGVTIEDDVFVGHNVTFINDRFPRSTIEELNDFRQVVGGSADCRERAEASERRRREIIARPDVEPFDVSQMPVVELAKA